MGDKIRAFLDRLAEKVKALVAPPPVLVPIPIKK
jgi:hypothetical protein